MAKKEEKSKIEIERTYNIPLRKEFQKAPKYKRAKKAVNALKRFLEKHMKSSDVKIGRYLNEKIWEKGIRNPPHHVKVNVTKDSEGVVRAELVDAPKEIKKEKTKKTKQKETKQKSKEVKEEEKTEIKEEKAEPKQKEEIEEKAPNKKASKEELKNMDAKGPKAEVPKAEELAKKKVKK